PPRSSHYPYTTLFRSHCEWKHGASAKRHAASSADRILALNSRHFGRQRVNFLIFSIDFPEKNVNLTVEELRHARTLSRRFASRLDRKSTRLNSSHQII